MSLRRTIPTPSALLPKQFGVLLNRYSLGLLKSLLFWQILRLLYRFQQSFKCDLGLDFWNLLCNNDALQKMTSFLDQIDRDFLLHPPPKSLSELAEES